MKREPPVVHSLPFSIAYTARVWIATLLVSGSLLSGLESLRCEEPYQRFLQKLQDEQLFDLALVYLDATQGKAGVSGELKADMQLERGLLLYQSAALLPAANAERPKKLDEAEGALQTFIDNMRNHPRRGEARMKLGELLLTRAEEAKRRAGNDVQSDNPEAIKFYDEAHQLFESTIGELSQIIEAMKGARVDPSDTAKVAYRQKIQQDVRQSQLLSAKSIDDRGRSRAVASPLRQKDLQTALEMFGDLYSKETRMVGVRNYALFYRSAIQSEMGKLDDAVDGYQRIADLEGVDILRPLQTSAVSELVKLLAFQKKFPLAVERAESWLNNLRPDERDKAETIALKLELARQKIQWSSELQRKDPNDRVASKLARDTRVELSKLLKVPGVHQEQTRELLGQLGIEKAEQATAELPQVKSFAEALAAAQERIDRSENTSIGLETLQLQTADAQTPPEKKKELAQQIQESQSAMDTDQLQAIELLRSALRLYSSSDAREQLFDARFRLSFLLLKQHRPWDAMSVAEFLSRANPSTENGLRAAAITLASFSDLLRSAGAESKVDLTPQLQPFAEYLLATWPDSSEAGAAASALVQLALINKEWDKAKQFLSILPPGGDAAGKLKRAAGVAFYAKHLEERKSAGDDDAAVKQLKADATQFLQEGCRDLDPAKMDAPTVDAINILARLYLKNDQLDAANQLLLEGGGSPIKILEGQPAWAPVPTIMETYRTAIQLTIARLVEDKVSPDLANTQVRDYIQRLQSAAKNEADHQTLATIFVGLARDLKELLANAKDETKRIKISETLLLVATEAAKADSFNSQFWAANTILSIAQELETTAAGKSQASKAYGSAATVLQQIQAKEKNQPGWINPPNFVTQVSLKRAQTLRGQGDYKAAIEELATILETNSALLDVQIEAAQTYQAWGDAVNSGFHKVAIEGGRPNPKTRKKLIWGWGEIQRLTANQPNFTEQFYEARYQLAYSRMQFAKGLADPAKKKEELGRAENDIQSTAKLFPDLGGPVMKKRFNVLLSTIQKQK